MTRWFRAYDDALDDPKVQRLPGELFKTWFNILCIASKHNGVLPDLPTIAFMLRKSEQEAKIDLDQLTANGLIDEDEAGLRPHNWQGRQFKSDVSNERVQRHRERQRNVTQPVTSTPPETEQIETERADARALQSHSGNGEFSRFRREIVALYAKHFPDELPPDTGLCDVWEGQGFTPSLCVSAIAENFERTKKFKKLNYFSGLLAELHTKKIDVPTITKEAQERAWAAKCERGQRNGTPESAWDVPSEFIARWKAKEAA